MATDKIQIAGDVVIRDVSIVTAQGFVQTITPQVAAIEIYEDIFSPFLTGKVCINDSQDLQNLLPLIGQETIRVHIHTPSLEQTDDYILDCMIYKMDDKFRKRERNLIYVLHFISREAIVDLNRYVSKGFKGNIHDIAKKIYTEELLTKKTLDIEETGNTTRFIANFWNPVRCLQWIADQAVNKQNVPSYLFFETGAGFHFRSLTSLYQGTEIKQRFIWDNYTAEITSTGGSVRSIERDFQRVLDIDMQDGWNYMERLKSGLYGSEILYYDIFTQQYVHKAYRPTWDKTKGLNEFPLWNEKSIADATAVLIHDHQYQNAFTDYADVSNTKIRQERNSLLAQAEGCKVTIEVFGRCDYKAGQRVILEIPKSTQIKKSDTDYLDKLTSGNYLISAICHRIEREKHSCSIELIKDSYMREI